VTEDRDEAFERFVRSRQAVLYRFAWLLTGGSHADAQDLVQDALVGVYRRWRDIDDPEPYARTAMVRRNISTWRRLRREVLTTTRLDTVVPVDLATEGVDGELVVCVLALPPRQRAAVVLRYWYDLGDDQIAEALGCAPVTVRTNIHRALAHLRRVWRERDAPVSPGRMP
jgi:RNA polymerase sigma-70 factor (sigma-E family)